MNRFELWHDSARCKRAGELEATAHAMGYDSALARQWIGTSESGTVRFSVEDAERLLLASEELANQISGFVDACERARDAAADYESPIPALDRLLSKMESS